MGTITLRLVEPERDFARLADLFAREEDESTTESSLKEDYRAARERIFRLMAAEDERGELLGFNWAVRERSDPEQAFFYVIVAPEHRRQGAGRRLYEDVERAARAAGVMQLQVSVRDPFPEYRRFAEACGYYERRHSIGMMLDLGAFDDSPYDAVLEKLRGEGFQFTTMAELGNTENAQRRLYALNDTAAAETPGSEGDHPWISFEDFQKRVCGADWYLPAGQNIVIDTSTGAWASMSAITHFSGVDYAYNLFTGTDRRYRGRKLAQAVKVLALRFARDVLAVKTVKTHHNSTNLPMIAIDRKLGYIQDRGYYTMEKILG